MAQKDGEVLEADKSKPKTTKAEEWDSLYDDSGECVKILENVFDNVFLTFMFLKNTNSTNLLKIAKNQR